MSAGATEAPLPESLLEATAEQPRVRVALAAALRAGPSHAYAFMGPSGSGKAAVARALAAELLAEGSDDPGETRRRALADPSPHPDLVWLRPPGTQHLVEEVRDRVIGAVSYRPFEGARRLFVIEFADAMAEESQNALLKTLEEPPPYAHLILLTAEPAALLPTIASRCQAVTFAPLPTASIARRLADEEPGIEPPTLSALAELAAGDLGRARILASETGRRLRAAVEACGRASRSSELTARPWAEILSIAADAGGAAGELIEAAAGERADELGKGRDADRVRRQGGEAAKRADRRARTAAVDLALALTAAWFADLATVAELGTIPPRDGDRAEELRADAEGLDPATARAAAELAMGVRRRLQVNVNEELALEALFHRAAGLLGDPERLH